jgi:hypothetical protein
MIRRLPHPYSEAGNVQKLTAFAAGDQTGLIISQRFCPALFPYLSEKRAGSKTPGHHSSTPL